MSGSSWLFIWSALSIPMSIWIWRKAARDAAKRVESLNPPPGLPLTTASEQWLRAQLARRTRWSVIVIETAIAVLVVAVLTFGEGGVIGWSLDAPRVFLIALIIGRAAGRSLAMVVSIRAGMGAQRSAALRPRTVKGYLRPWEHRLYIVMRTTVVSAAIVIVTLYGLGLLTDAGAFYTGLAGTWLALGAGSELVLRRVLRSPPIVGADLHQVREYLMSATVRGLIGLQMAVLVIVAFVAATYAEQNGDLPPGFGDLILGVACSYIAWTLIGSIERDLDEVPGPEWHFARTTGSPA